MSSYAAVTSTLKNLAQKLGETQAKVDHESTETSTVFRFESDQYLVEVIVHASGGLNYLLADVTTGEFLKEGSLSYADGGLWGPTVRDLLAGF